MLRLGRGRWWESEFNDATIKTDTHNALRHNQLRPTPKMNDDWVWTRKSKHNADQGLLRKSVHDWYIYNVYRQAKFANADRWSKKNLIRVTKWTVTWLWQERGILVILWFPNNDVHSLTAHMVSRRTKRIDKLARTFSAIAYTIAIECAVKCNGKIDASTPNLWRFSILGNENETLSNAQRILAAASGSIQEIIWREYFTPSTHSRFSQISTPSYIWNFFHSQQPRISI